MKPVLHVDTEGRLAAESKVRGRKKALNQLLAEMDICTGGYADKQDVVLICHADCPEDAEYVRAKVEEKYHPNKIIMSEVGPIVGAHERWYLFLKVTSDKLSHILTIKSEGMRCAF